MADAYCKKNIREQPGGTYRRAQRKSIKMKMIRHIRRFVSKHSARSIAVALAGLAALTSCVDFDDATDVTSVSVQLVQPTDFTSDADLGSKTVSLIYGQQTISAKTDAHGIATFTNIVPDVYDISTSWSMTAAEYKAATGSNEVVSGATVSGSLNAQLIRGAETLTLQTNVSADRDIVIGKVFYAGSKDNNNRSYIAGKYIELYNQSEKTVDVSGLYIGIVEAESKPAYTLADLHNERADSVVLLKQLYRIPADATKMVAPGGTVVICNSATDHTVNNSLEHNLLDADFEVKDITGRYQNNPATPAMEMIYQIYNGTSIMNMLQGGPVGVVIFRTDENVAAWQKVYRYGKTSGQQWLLCPRRLVLDGMEALTNKVSGIDVSTKRLYDNIDAGYTYINATTGWSGETVYRKTLRRSPQGHRILVDTNNSSNDFKVSKTIQPREYDD